MDKKQDQSIDIESILKLMAGMKESGIDYLELDDEATSLVLKRHKPQAPVTLVRESDTALLPLQTAAPVVGTEAATASSSGNDVEEAAEVPVGQIVTAPVVGIFFAAASPDADPFVEVGSEVKKGDIVCIIEAMKLMNEVSSTAGGKILEIYVTNGEKVQYGDPLFRIG